MQADEWKCVMVIDRELPVGVIANTAGILGITVGKELPEQVGKDVKDASGHNTVESLKSLYPYCRETRNRCENCERSSIAQNTRMSLWWIFPM